MRWFRRSADGARFGGDPSAPLWQAELSLRGRRGAARGDGVHLLGAEQDQVGHSVGVGGGRGASSGRALPVRAGEARGGRGDRPRRAARPAGGTAGASVSGSGSGEGDPAGFSASCERFDSVSAFLDGATGAALSQAEMEERLTVQGRDLLRQLYQDHLDLRAEREPRVDVVEVGGGLPAPGWSRDTGGHFRRLSVSCRYTGSRTALLDRRTCIR